MGHGHMYFISKKNLFLSFNDGWMAGQMVKQMDWMTGCFVRWMDGYIDSWRDIYRWIDSCIDRYRQMVSLIYFCFFGM